MRYEVRCGMPIRAEMPPLRKRFCTKPSTTDPFNSIQHFTPLEAPTGKKNTAVATVDCEYVVDGIQYA